MRARRRLRVQRRDRHLLIVGGVHTGEVVNGDGWLGGTLNTASSGRPNNVKICGGKQGTLRALCDISKYEKTKISFNVFTIPLPPRTVSIHFLLLCILLKAIPQFSK